MKHLPDNATVAQDIVSSVKASTLEGYGRSVKLWLDFCVQRKLNPYNVLTSSVLQFVCNSKKTHSAKSMETVLAGIKSVW